MLEVPFNEKLRQFYFEIDGDGVKEDKAQAVMEYIDARATELGLRGWVNPTTDGHIEGYAEGTMPQLDALRNLMLPGDCEVGNIESASFGFEECITEFTIDEGFEIDDINAEPYVNRVKTDFMPLFDEPFNDEWGYEGEEDVFPSPEEIDFLT